MNDFLQDLWHDLRAKRLLPVAAAMLVGIVAIPVLLAESSAEAPPAVPSASTDQVGGQRAPLTLETETAASSGTGSELDVFTPDDPFAPPKKVTEAKDAATSAEAGGKQAGADGGAGDGQGGSGGGQGGGGQGGGSPDSPAPVAPPKTSEYEYVVDVTFWNGSRRTKRRLHKLDMLPSQDAPALIFMGVTGGGGDAVFLVDSTLDAVGEGNCKPSNDNCVYVHLGPGSEHVFTGTDDGRAYRLRVDEIRRVEVDASVSTSDAPTASTATGSPAEPRPFALPSLIDVVVETTADGSHSSIAEAGR